jgi:hypothetical protein
MASKNLIEIGLLAWVIGCGSNVRHPPGDSGALAPDVDATPADPSTDVVPVPDRAWVADVTATDGTMVEADHGTMVPQALTTFASDVSAASDAALGGSGPQVCSAAIPPVQVALSSDMDAAIVRYISAIVGVPETALAVEPQHCGDANSAPCANVFQNDVAHFGGSNALTTYPLAQQLEATSTDVRVAIYSPTDAQGLGLPAIVAMSGIHDGWLMAIATFGDRTSCR